MPLFQFNNIKIAGMASAVPKNIVRTESFKEYFGEEEVNKFMLMTGVTETRQNITNIRQLLIWVILLQLHY